MHFAMHMLGNLLYLMLCCAGGLLPCRIVAPMSETEKLINKQLLEKVAQAGLGQLGAAAAAGPGVRTKTTQQQSRAGYKDLC